MSKKAILLLSGGLDSTTTLAMAKAEGFAVYALSFAYGQRHAHEIDAAKNIAMQMGAHEHRIATIDLAIFGASALTSANIPVPKDRSDTQMSADIPATYVPARNSIFLAYALAWAEVLGSADIYIGVNAVDYSGYPDCRPEFIEAFERMANLATKAGVEGRKLTIHTPLIGLTKAEIITRGLALGVDYRLTTSCYDPKPNGNACGRCDACSLRKKGFADAGIPDPTSYA
jgi:7-cyano-7-deazaguanine synthase